jgi:hypothetical protein
MVRKTKRRGGMLKTVAQPLVRASFALGKSVGQDYIQKKSAKISKGIYEDNSLATNPGFLLTGIKPMPTPNIEIYDKENANPNYKGGTRKKYKRRKTRKNRK